MIWVVHSLSSEMVASSGDFQTLSSVDSMTTAVSAAVVGAVQKIVVACG